MMSLWDALRMNMMISYQELVRTFRWPVNTPVNASPHTSRYATHDSGTLWIAGPSMVGDFHPLISNRSPGAHCIYIHISKRNKDFQSSFVYLNGNVFTRFDRFYSYVVQWVIE
ncbi:hypothetical protein EI690_08620 [Klebsiella pneumoniae]|nr:hypothetical protein EI690_08620 [Klebsiella pneumoniae]